jgi:nucleoside-diphosphate-sugar epimerase
LTFTIFGSTGFIGSHLVRALRSRGVECVAPARDEDVFALRHGLGHVVYAIGVTADFRTRSIDTVRAHVSRLADVLEHAEFETFTYLSSTRLYSGAAAAVEETTFEIDPRSMSDLYNLSKLMGESLVLARAGERARIARLSNVYGADWTSENFLMSLIRDAVTKGSVVIRTSPDSSKDYVAVDDVVSLLISIAARGKHTIYNVASGQPLINRELAAALGSAAACPVTFAPDAATVAFPTIDINRIREEFGAPARSLIDDLPQLVAEFKRTFAA